MASRCLWPPDRPDSPAPIAVWMPVGQVGDLDVEVGERQRLLDVGVGEVPVEADVVGDRARDHHRRLGT